MTLEERLAAIREQSKARRPAEVRAVFLRSIDDLRASGIMNRVAKVGSRAPDFTLPNAGGQPVRLEELRARGPVVLSFYRGRWWPYCNAELDALQQATRVRVEEIVWGGVAKDGIPALMNPPHVPAARATYLTDDEPVFGVTLNGQSRAYPHRIMDWHEMANDVIGGVPVALAYWTLCGSGTLYQATAQGTTYTFGSSGLLFRSNKLMYDHQTNSLWNHLRGEPVVGPLARTGVQLTVLPVVVTSWREWRTEHPDTTVLDINTGYVRDYAPGRPYGRYFASPDTMFPVSPRNDQLRTKDLVYAVRIGAAHKAYPLDALRRTPVVNDRVGVTNVVVLGKADGRSARAYERGTLTFQPGASPGELVVKTSGARWRVEEERLVEPATGRALPRLGGHVVYWFGWYAFYPDAEVYRP